MIVRSWLEPAFSVAEPVIASVAAVPGVPVAVNVTGDPAREPDVAVKVLAPADVPRVQDVTAATPEEFVVTAEAGASDPPPDAIAKVTDVPEIGLPAESVTSTLGAVATAVPTVADCPLPA